MAQCKKPVVCWAHCPYIVGGTSTKLKNGSLNTRFLSVPFRSNRQLHTHNAILLQCARIKLTRHTHAKYLGAKLDQSLSGDGMAETVISKTNARLRYLFRQVKNVDQKTKIPIASASTSSGLIKRYKAWLGRTQNKIIRFRFKAPPRTNIGPHEFDLVCMVPVKISC